MSGISGGSGGAWTVISNTATGATNDWAPAGLSGNTLIEWNGASDAAFTGLAGGVTGQIVTVKNITAAKIATFAHLVTSSAGNQFSNYATSAPTPIFTRGFITFQYDGTNWKIVGHEQGAWITPAYAAGDFTASGSMTWGVDAGDVRTYRYKLDGNTLLVEAIMLTTTTGGTASFALYVKVPGGFSAAAEYTGSQFYFNTAAPWTMGPVWIEPTTIPTKIQIYTAGFGNANWTLGTHNVGVYASLALEVL